MDTDSARTPHGAVDRVAEPLVRLAAAGLLDLASSLREVAGARDGMEAADRAALDAAIPPVPPEGFAPCLIAGVLCGDVAIGTREQGAWISCRPDDFDLNTAGDVPLAAAAGAVGGPLLAVASIPALDPGDYVIEAACVATGGVAGLPFTRWTCRSTSVSLPFDP